MNTNSTGFPADTDFTNGRTMPHVLLALVSGILISLLVVFVKYFDQAEVILLENEHNYVQLDRIDALLIALLNVETGATGYILSGDKEFLTTFSAGAESIQLALTAPKRKWKNSPYKDSIYELSVDIYDVIQQLNALVQNTSLTRAEMRHELTDNKRLMDDLRGTLNTIRSGLVSRTSLHHNRNLGYFNRIQWAIIFLCVIAFSLLFIVFALAQKQQRLMKQVSLELARKNAELESTVNTRTNELIDLASYLTRSSEDERKRIARELHDELGALLTAARMDVSWIARNLDPKDHERFQARFSRLSDSLDQGIALKRQITSSLIPPLLRELGLVEAIRAMTEDMGAEDHPSCTLRVKDSLPELSEDEELALFRICQESLTNIKKYANASRVDISLDYKDGRILLKISDDGRGFDPQKKPKGTHGLAGMRARAAMFGGTLKVDAGRNKGTVIQASLPVMNISETRTHDASS